MTNLTLAKEIYEAAHLTGIFTLRSGQVANEYFDKYLFEADPVILAKIADELVERIPGSVEVLAGLELGAIPIVTALSMKSGLPAAFVRKKAKEYGTAKLAEGTDIKGKKVCVIEDVITTGGQIILSTNDLRAAGSTVEHVICVIERSPEGRKNLDQIGLAVHSLYTMDDLIEVSKSF